MKLGDYPDSGAIQDMFERLAPRYDLFNHLSCFGLDILWKRYAVKSIEPGMRVLDLGCGTGDLSLGSLKRLKGTGLVTGLDFSEAMLNVARKRLKRLPPAYRQNAQFLLRPAEDLPLDGTAYDAVVSGFVLRNIYENIDSILGGVGQSLKAGGQIRFLDLTEPRNPLAKLFWRFYVDVCIEFYGRVLFGRDYPEFYLTQSAHRFLKRDEFITKLKEKGFSDVKAENLFLGMIVLYTARKAS